VALSVESGDSESPCFHGYVQSKCLRGANNGQDCATHADCPKACQGGSNNGNPCTSNSDCPPLGIGYCKGFCDEGRLGPEAFYKLSSEWGTVRVRGPEIRPASTYRVRTQADGPAGLVRSAAATVTTRVWGDVDGNGSVSGLDVTWTVNAFRHLVGPSFEAANVWGHGSTPCTPNDPGDIDALDIVLVVDAFKGFPYACAIPACTPSPPRNPYRFQGKRLDFDVRGAGGVSLLATMHWDQRTYGPSHARFLQHDPLGYVDGMNLYEAFKGNPLRFVDPTGLKNWEAYNKAAAQHGQFYAAFWDVWGFFEYTPPRGGYNAIADDAFFLIDEIKQARTEGLKLLGESLELGVEVLGAFNLGADLAIVVDEVSEGKINLAQLGILLPFVPSNKQLALMSRCGKVLKRIPGKGEDVIAAIRPWKEIDRLTHGIRAKNKVDAHHLIEVRFAKRLRIQDTGDIEGILVDVLLHRGAGPDSITRRMYNEIPYRANGNYDDVSWQAIYEAHKRVYTDVGIPEAIEAINHWFQRLGVTTD